MRAPRLVRRWIGASFVGAALVLAVPLAVATLALTLGVCALAAWQAPLLRVQRRFWSRPLIAAMFSSMQRAQDRICAPLSQKERDVFMATLARLIEANNEYGRGPLRID